MKIGTKSADKVEELGRTSLRKLQEWAKEDPNTVTDDALRLIGGGLKNVGKVANLPGIKQGLQLADAPFHYLAKGAGKAAGAAGIDPRWGEWLVRTGELATGVGVGKKAATTTAKLSKLGTIKGAHKLAKTELPGNQLARQVLDRHIQGKARDVLGSKSSLSKMHSQIAPQFGGDARALMSNLDSAMWQSQYKRLGDVKDPVEQLAKKEDFLTTQYSKDLKDFYVEGGKITPKALAKDPDTMQKLMDRADKIVEGFAKGDQRKLYDQASWNIFEDAKEVYGQSGLVKKIQAAFLGVQGKQWHHMFGNKEAGEFLLNRVAQDPVIAANLFQHMEKLGLKSGAIAENMALMRAAPHNSWHRFMEEMGF